MRAEDRLARFLDAQADPFDGFDTALRELRAGRKQRHWIWYVFPQLRGLGRSPAAQAFGLAGVSEANAFLQHPELRSRLIAAATAVLDHVQAGVPLRTIMGSDIDVVKLISSMTLFAGVARRAVTDETSGTECARLADVAEAILAAGAREGYPPCAFTLEQLASSAL